MGSRVYTSLLVVLVDRCHKRGKRREFILYKHVHIEDTKAFLVIIHILVMTFPRAIYVKDVKFSYQ